MLTMVGAGPTGKSTKDWHEVWKNSEQAKDVQRELENIKQEMGIQGVDENAGSQTEFAMPLTNQLYEVTIRVFQQYWRTPGYIYAKLVLGVASALFIGFSFFHADTSQQGIQDIIFSIFMITTIFTTIVQQIMPRFITQRDLYEVRERPSKAYSWKAFLIANIVVEIPYQILLGIMVFASYFYPIYTKGGIPSSSRQGLILLLVMQFFVFASTFAHMLIAALPDAETAGKIGTFMFSMALSFNGVFQPPNALPGFWIFMYRVSPLTCRLPSFSASTIMFSQPIRTPGLILTCGIDFVSAVATTGISGRSVTCSSNELAVMQPPAGQTCGQYLGPFASAAGGSIYNPLASADCQYCTLSNADEYLASVAMSYSTRWRNYGIGFAFIVFNISMAVLLYYLLRVRKWSGIGMGMGARLAPVLSLFKKKAARNESKEEATKKKASDNPDAPILPQ